MLADKARQLHEVNGGDQADVDLGIAERRGVARDDHVAGNRDRHAAGAHRAVNGCDGGLAHAVLHVVQREIKLLQEFLRLDGRLAPDDSRSRPAHNTLCALPMMTARTVSSSRAFARAARSASISGMLNALTGARSSIIVRRCRPRPKYG